MRRVGHEQLCNSSQLIPTSNFKGFDFHSGFARFDGANGKELRAGSRVTYCKECIATPYPIMNGLQLASKRIAQCRLEIYQYKAEECVDSSFIAELDKSGLVKKLYG